MRLAFLSIGLLLAVVSCRQEAGIPGKPVVTVSILPQKYFVERLADDLVEVNVMVPAGASPASYEPTISQLNGLARSSLYLKMGHLGFELAWIDKIMGANPGMKVVDLSEGIALIVEEEGPEVQDHVDVHGGVDPHIWMSVENVRIIAGHVHRELLLQFPEAREKLELGYNRWIRELDSLHLTISRNLADLPLRSFMIYHPALAYFARDYNLKQYPLELGGKTPSPSLMKRMIDLSTEQGIRILFVQRQFDQHNARVLASETGAEIVPIDPLDPDWKGQMIYISERLKNLQP